ncbi:uncharacterized protein [Watersipora subatra]|uniref:uncharacterized protein n=1 Tax=Watersipora subatra TaxID=2589382 RepID=UPI00355BAB9C
MTSVKFDSVLSCSSQDQRNPASNLLNSSGGSWLRSALDSKLNRVDVSLRLTKSCVITHIDIGNHGSFSVEVQVGCDDGPYATLINQSTFMTVSDSRMGKNLHAVKMFKSEDFDSTQRGKLSDRIKLICFQPYRKDKSFGIAMLKVMTDSNPEQDSPGSQTPDKKLLQKYQESKDSKISKESWLKGAMHDRLQQIASTGQMVSSDRSMQMVIASIKSPSHRTPLINDLLNKSSPTTSKPTFMSSVRSFFRKLDMNRLDPYALKVSELRHQFEKVKSRKLSSDEKKLFKKYTLEVFESQFGEMSRESQNHAEGRTPVNKTPRADLKTLKLANDLAAKLSEKKKLPSLKPLKPRAKEPPPVIVLDDDTFPENTSGLASVSDVMEPNISSSKVLHFNPARKMNFSHLDASLKNDLNTFVNNRWQHHSKACHSKDDSSFKMSDDDDVVALDDVVEVKDVASTAIPASSTALVPTCSAPPYCASSPLTAIITRNNTSTSKLSTGKQLANPFVRRSTAMSQSPACSQLIRTEIRPLVSKRSLDELYEDDDDLLLPVAKKSAAETISLKPDKSSGSGRRLTLDSLLSSEDEDAEEDAINQSQSTYKPSINNQDFSLVSTEGATNQSVQCSTYRASSSSFELGNLKSASHSSYSSSIVLSSDSEDLPDLQVGSDVDSLLDI